jgi:hypothetical protein
MGCQLNGFDPAGLVETIAILVRDMTKHSGCGLPFQAASQSFVGEDAPRRSIHNGLKGHGKIEAESCAVGALGATERTKVERDIHKPCSRVILLED